MQHNMLLKVVVALSAASLSAAQALSSLPALSTATLTTASTTSAAASTTSAAASSTTASSTSATSATSTASFPALSSSTSAVATAVSTVTSGSAVFTISSGYPTIAGAGIPTMIVPNTAGAPFMQQSTMPEGTVFIAVGAVLAFLGACVLLWRGAVAWSINRSVKQAALASIRGGSEKTSKNWGGAGSGYNPAFKGATYHDLGSSVSMEALTPTGKQMKSHFKDIDSGRSTPPQPANLFFSPTAQGRSVNSMYSEGNRNSSYLPAGYYAQPSSQVAGGNRNTIIGGTVPPFARNSAYEPSPPGSPGLRPSNGLHPRGSHDNLRAPPSRDGKRNTMYSQISNSSLAANLGARPGSTVNLGGSRAPSAYLEEMFENHTAMASRDRL